MLIVTSNTIKDTDAERDLTKGGAKVVYPIDLRTAVWDVMTAQQTSNIVVIAIDQHMAQVLDPLYSQLFTEMPVKMIAVPNVEVEPEFVRFVSSLVGVDWMTIYKMISKPGTQRTGLNSNLQSTTATPGDISVKLPEHATEDFDIDLEML